jgi:hypothetical protein
MVTVNWATRGARVQTREDTAVVFRAAGSGTTANAAAAEPLSDEVKG